MAKETLANNLKKLLKQNAKTQTDMANDLNISQSTVSSWMKSVKYPRRDKIEMMADYFGVMPSDITDDKENQVTAAAHFDKENLTEDELREVEQFIEFIKNRRKG